MSVVVRGNAAAGLYAVRLSWLEEFTRRLDPDCLTYEVVTKIVIPETGKLGCR